jgi:uncharacterized protein YbaR (Trm112 family)
LRENFKALKLQFVPTIIAFVLIFYAIGIETDFFASPVFSMFAIISYQTAHNVAIYVASFTAVGLVLVATCYTALFNKSKKTEAKTAPFSIQYSFGVPTKLTAAGNDQKITKYLVVDRAEKTDQTIKQQEVGQLTRGSMAQLSNQSNIDRNGQANQDEDMMICSVCKSRFRAPTYQIDSSSKEVELIRICPFCRQSLDYQPENTLDDWWVRTFNDSPISTR